MKSFKKPICAILVLAICVGICSCSPFGVNPGKYAVARAAEKQSVSYEDSRDEGYQEFLCRLSDFSAALTESLYQGFGTVQASQVDNLCFSPLSVYMALALAAECAEGETRQQILDALGMSYEEVKAYTKVLYAFSNKSLTDESEFSRNKKVSAFEELHNSIWLDDSVSINTDTANNLSKSFNTDVFAADFKNGKAQKAIKKYIEDKTHGLVDGDIELDPEAVCVLLNTLYLKEIWNNFGDELEKTGEKYTFLNTDGSKEKINLLKGYYQFGRAYKGEHYQSFYAETAHGYKLHFILPDQGVILSDVFTENNISTVLGIKDYGGTDNENKENHYTRIFFPEFEADFDENIAAVLKKDFGIVNLFSFENARLSLDTKDPGANIYCDQIIHRTAIKVNEKGIEGAAITAVALDGAADGVYNRVNHDLIIDKAFGFILTDSYGMVLFSGVVNKID